MTEHTSDITEGKLERIADSYRGQERTVAIVDDDYRIIGPNPDYIGETD